MPTHQSGGHDPSASASHDGEPGLESDDVYELQDHEFTLEAEETIKIPPGPVVLPEPVDAESRSDRSSAPPLPRWAAASRALLDTWMHGDPDQTIEVPPSATPANIPGPGISERAARERLQNLARRLHVREVYLLEVERALVVATARLRGQSFRIAELEDALATASAPVLAPAPRSMPEPVSVPTTSASILAIAAPSDELSDEPQPLQLMAACERLGLVHEPPAIPPLPAAPSMVLEPAPRAPLFARPIGAPEPLPQLTAAAPASATERAARKPKLTKPKRQASGSADELQRVRGIGPGYAAELSALGMSLKTLATANTKTLARIAATLGISEARIQRERWQKQAQTLVAKPKQPSKPTDSRKPKRTG